MAAWNQDQRAEDKFLEWQYHTLRQEIETSKDRHFKITAGTLILVPAIELLTIAVKELVVEQGMVTILVVPMSLLLMVLPVVVLILYVLYLSEHYAITRCGHYIREYIEPVVGKPNSWEHWEPWKGWEQWLGSTWLEYRAASKVGYGTQQVERRRVHEDLQMVAFRVLYLSLFFVAAVSAGFVCFRATEQLTQSVGYAVEAVVVLISLYIIAGGYVWWKVQKAARQVGHKIENEEADLAVTSSVTLLVGFPVPPGAGSRSGRPRQNQRSSLSPAGQQAP